MPSTPRDIFEAEHEDFRRTVRSFFDKEVTPHHEQWEQEGAVSREVWTKAGEAGLLVPSTAVFEHQGGNAVWVLQPEGELVKPVLRPVKVRQYREDGAVLSEGLKAGETIALAGVHKIVAGQPLRPRQPASPGVVPVAVKAEG